MVHRKYEILQYETVYYKNVSLTDEYRFILNEFDQNHVAGTTKLDGTISPTIFCKAIDRITLSPIQNSRVTPAENNYDFSCVLCTQACTSSFFPLLGSETLGAGANGSSLYTAPLFTPKIPSLFRGRSQKRTVDWRRSTSTSQIVARPLLQETGARVTVYHGFFPSSPLENPWNCAPRVGLPCRCS